jgi:hypothetical protein
MWFHRDFLNSLDAMIVPQAGRIPQRKELREPEYSTDKTALLSDLSVLGASGCDITGQKVLGDAANVPHFLTYF